MTNPVTIDASIGKRLQLITGDIGAVNAIVENPFTFFPVTEVETVLGASDSLRALDPGPNVLAAVVDGVRVAGDTGGGTWYWDPTSALADNIGTVIQPTAHVGPGRWIRIYSGALELKWFGAFCDNASDDTTFIQAWIDAAGDTTQLRAATWHAPNGGTSVITGTLIIDRKQGVFLGPGAGSTLGGGFTLRWDGAGGIPMLQVKRCQGLRFQGFRFIGKTGSEPSEAINFLMTTGDAPPNSDNVLEHIWIGGLGGLDTAYGKTVKGITTTGDNAQNDQSVCRDITIQGVTDACFDFTDTQNVVWRLEHIILNDAVCGIRAGTRFIQVSNAFFSTITNCIELANDGGLAIENFGAEGCSRFLLSTTGAQNFSAKRGYFQSNAALIPGDNGIINVTTGAFGMHLESVDFTRSGVFAAGQEKLIIVTSQGLLTISPDTTFPDFPGTSTDAHFAFSGANPGDPISVFWGDNFFNHWLDGAALTTSKRTDFTTLARLLADVALGGVDSGGVERNLVKLNTTGNITELGYTGGTLKAKAVLNLDIGLGGTIICFTDLRGGTGVDVTEFRRLILDQVISRIEFTEAGHNTHQWRVNGVDVLTTNDNAGATGGLGFYTHAPAARPDITGSKGGNAALADLLTKLAGLGLLTDSTT